eukprot:COSAG01_NODE_32417_length_581_cov_10.477178_1_plen_62_part_10
MRHEIKMPQMLQALLAVHRPDTRVGCLPASAPHKRQSLPLLRSTSDAGRCSVAVPAGVLRPR